MRRVLVALLMAGGVALGGCCKKKPPPDFPVNICLHASPQVQLYEGRPHTLYVRVFPLELPDAFAAADAGDLLADPPPVVQGVTGTPQSRTLYPNTTGGLSFDAVANRPFSYLGVVAGYYKPQGPTKHVVGAAELRKGACYTVEFGPSGIEGGAPAKNKDTEGKDRK